MRGFVASILAIGLGAGPAGLGCSSLADDCDNTLCGDTPTTGVISACIPSKNGGPVDDSCGVFVSSSLGDDVTAKGTKAAPYATLQRAADASAGKPIYACAESFDETVILSGSRSLFGGLDCEANWVWVGESRKTTLIGEPDAVPLTINASDDELQIEDLAVLAADASEPGASSIAVMVDEATLAFRRCELTAGAGAPGIAAEDRPGEAERGENGNDGGSTCGAGKPIDGTGGRQSCGLLAVDGGNGGHGGSNANLLPQFGETGDPSSAGGGIGGLAETGSAPCTSGTAGAPGEAGAPGAGGTAPGELTAAGITAVDGEPGGDGKPGQGGGGGGGSLKCPDGSEGPGGGGGGSAGCGGLGGKAGTGGGSSIALASVQAAVTLTDSVLITSAGGAGGDGGGAEAGGAPGVAGSSGRFAQSQCTGGNGGVGGSGGAGGGGRGGHSLGVAFVGEAPVIDGSSFELGLAGKKGRGGQLVAASSGEEGEACTVLEIADGASCGD